MCTVSHPLNPQLRTDSRALRTFATSDVPVHNGSNRDSKGQHFSNTLYIQTAGTPASQQKIHIGSITNISRGAIGLWNDVPQPTEQLQSTNKNLPQQIAHAYVHNCMRSAKHTYSMYPLPSFRFRQPTEQSWATKKNLPQQIAHMYIIGISCNQP